MAPAPTAAERMPTQGKKSFDCPHCATFSKQHWSKVYRRDPGNNIIEAVDQSELHVSDGGRSWQSRVGVWQSAQCDACDDFSMWRDEELIYPRASGIESPSADMPEQVAELYNEARDVMPVSRRAGAALARATLERLLKALDPSQSTASLAQRIDAVIPQVSSSLASMLTVIRHVGNKSLHAEDEPDDAVVLVLDETQTELVGLIFEAINELVDERITKPAASKRFLDLVPENVLKNVKGL